MRGWGTSKHNCLESYLLCWRRQSSLLHIFKTRYFIYIYIYIYIHSYTLLRRGTFSPICIIQPTTRSRWKFRICTYTMIVLCIIFLYTFLWPEDGPQLPKHVVRMINRIQDCCVLTFPTPSLIAYNATGIMHLKIMSVNALWDMRVTRTIWVFDNLFSIFVRDSSNV